MKYNINIGDFILAITFIALVWTAMETRRLANETVQANLRPLILREGQIIDWKVLSLEDLKMTNNHEPTLAFINLKNTAKDITGYIVLNNKKHTLLFHGKVRGAEIQNGTEKKVVYNVKWGWLPSGGILVSSYNEKEFTETKERNQIYLSYKDIEDNSYYTKEDNNYSSISKMQENRTSLTKLFGVGLVLLGSGIIFI